MDLLGTRRVDPARQSPRARAYGGRPSPATLFIWDCSHLGRNARSAILDEPLRAPHVVLAAIPTAMLMRLLVSFTKGIMMAIGITLPKPEQEKTVAIVWVVAFFVMIGIIAGVGWLVLKSFSNSPQ
jgi:hypothetical protein